MGEGWLSFSTFDLIRLRGRDRKAGYMWVLSVLNRHSTVTFALDSVEASTSTHCRYLSTIYYHYQVARYLVTAQPGVGCAGDVVRSSCVTKPTYLRLN